VKLIVDFLTVVFQLVYYLLKGINPPNLEDASTFSEGAADEFKVDDARVAATIKVKIDFC
jgi:hypothetical protein